MAPFQVIVKHLSFPFISITIAVKLQNVSLVSFQPKYQYKTVFSPHNYHCSSTIKIHDSAELSLQFYNLRIGVHFFISTKPLENNIGPSANFLPVGYSINQSLYSVVRIEGVSHMSLIAFTRKKTIAYILKHHQKQLPLSIKQIYYGRFDKHVMKLESTAVEMFRKE